MRTDGRGESKVWMCVDVWICAFQIIPCVYFLGLQSVTAIVEQIPHNFICANPFMNSIL